MSLTEITPLPSLVISSPYDRCCEDFVKVTQRWSERLLLLLWLPLLLLLAQSGKAFGTIREIFTEELFLSWSFIESSVRHSFTAMTWSPRWMSGHIAASPPGFMSLTKITPLPSLVRVIPYDCCCEDFVKVTQRWSMGTTLWSSLRASFKAVISAISALACSLTALRRDFVSGNLGICLKTVCRVWRINSFEENAASCGDAGW